MEPITENLATRRTPGARVRARSLTPLATLGAFVLFARALAAAEPEPAASMDATCAWGRLSDGKGRLVRCLTEVEATRLRAPPAFSWSDVQKAAEATLAAVAPADTAARPAPPEPAPPAVPPPAVPPAPGAPAAEVVRVSAEIASVVADTGSLGDATKSLKKAYDRLAECVEKNGGLSGDRATVEVRFLVQERGRAEGVSVKKKHGVTDAAAKCIADVMDRRFVGYPEAPAVGATAAVVITKKK